MRSKKKKPSWILLQRRVATFIVYLEGISKKPPQQEQNNSRLQRERDSAAERARVEFESIPNVDTIAESSAQRDKFKKELVDFEAQHTTVSNEIERVQKEIERKEQAPDTSA